MLQWLVLCNYATWVDLSRHYFLFMLYYFYLKVCRLSLKWSKWKENASKMWLIKLMPKWKESYIKCYKAVTTWRIQIKINNGHLVFVTLIVLWYTSKTCFICRVQALVVNRIPPFERCMCAVSVRYTSLVQIPLASGVTVQYIFSDLLPVCNMVHER